MYILCTYKCQAWKEAYYLICEHKVQRKVGLALDCLVNDNTRRDEMSHQHEQIDFSKLDRLKGFWILQHLSV